MIELLRSSRLPALGRYCQVSRRFAFRGCQHFQHISGALKQVEQLK
jgi:hypothetical protein